MQRLLPCLCLLGCSPTEAPPTIAVPTPLEPLPQGAFDAAFFYAFEVAGTPWNSTPAASLDRTPGTLSLTITEIWREDSPFFPDCPIVVTLDGTVSDEPLIYDVELREVLEDPCSIDAYAQGDRFVVRFVTRDQAFEWLAPAMDVSTAFLEAGEGDLENTIGPVGDWFVFWGPTPDVLWPIGHIFD